MKIRRYRVLKDFTFGEREDGPWCFYEDAEPLLKRVKELEQQKQVLEANLEVAVKALDEALYFLAPDQDDMEKKAGIYRIVSAYEELKGQDDG